jgi:signal transduction histidine kinase
MTTAWLGLPAHWLHALGERLRSSALAWPLAAAAAVVVLVINEAGHGSAVQALTRLGERSAANLQIQSVLRRLLDAETGQRGYLITGRKVYLEPCAQASADTVSGLDWLQNFYIGDPHGQALLGQLRSQAQTRLAELEATVAAFDAGQQERVNALLAAESAAHMDAMRRLVDALATDQRRQVSEERQAVFETLRRSRIGVNLSAGLGLLALLMLLRQMAAVDDVRQRHAQALQDEHLRLEDEVVRRSDDLSELARHLQTVREDESSRLARDLHDELGALLTATKLDVLRLRRDLAEAAPEVLGRLDHLAGTIDSGISLKRRIIEDLRPASLSNLGLLTALHIQAREFGERSGLAVTTELQPVTLSDASEITAYRLVQEALTNVAKYAQARRVVVSLQQRDGRAHLSVQDDGRGFNPDAPRPSAHGLMGMLYRVQSVGGVLAIHSSPGRGTRIEAELPLAADATGTAAQTA